MCPFPKNSISRHSLVIEGIELTSTSVQKTALSLQ
jgi:hypothetical protein